MRTDKFHTTFKPKSHIDERSFEFAAATVRLIKRYGDDMPQIVADKIVGLGTEIGHQVADAHIGNNPKRFQRRMTEARRMSREIAYWLRIAEATELVPQDVVVQFLEEAREIHKTIVKACSEADDHDSN